MKFILFFPLVQYSLLPTSEKERDNKQTNIYHHLIIFFFLVFCSFIFHYYCLVSVLASFPHLSSPDPTPPQPSTIHSTPGMNPIGKRKEILSRKPNIATTDHTQPKLLTHLSASPGLYSIIRSTENASDEINASNQQSEIR